MADTQIGNNITARQDGNKIVITIVTDKPIGDSHSGKNIIHASTGGNVSFGGLTIGINVYKKK